MQSEYNQHALSMLSACNRHAVSMQSACNRLAISLQPVGGWSALSYSAERRASAGRWAGNSNGRYALAALAIDALKWCTSASLRRV